jgi:hypothetical protein
MDDADDIGPLFGKASRLNKSEESRRHLRPTVEASFQTAKSVTAFALVFVAGRHTAFLAGEARPIGQQVSGADAKTSGIRGESGSANGVTIPRKMGDELAMVNAGQTQELSACGSAAKLAGSGAKGGEDLLAGKHGGV